MAAVVQIGDSHRYDLLGMCRRVIQHVVEVLINTVIRLAGASVGGVYVVVDVKLYVANTVFQLFPNVQVLVFTSTRYPIRPRERIVSPREGDFVYRLSSIPLVMTKPPSALYTSLLVSGVGVTLSSEQLMVPISPAISTADRHRAGNRAFPDIRVPSIIGILFGYICLLYHSIQKNRQAPNGSLAVI
jgi:hypothetical protein